MTQDTVKIDLELARALLPVIDAYIERNGILISLGEQYMDFKYAIKQAGS